MRSRKGINILALIFAFALSFAVTAYLLYEYVQGQQEESILSKPLSLLDSVAFKYALNLDSLRADSSFIRMLTKDLTEDDIYTQMLAYSDDEVAARFTDSTKKTPTDSLSALADTVQFMPTDSLRKIMALKDLSEQKLTDYVTNNQERFNLLKEKKGLVGEVSKLQKQIDTISTKTEKVIGEYKNKKDSLDMVARENARLIEEANQTKGQNFVELVRKYEAMKPVKAAEILVDMPDEEVVKLLKKMNNRQAGKILTALPPAKAANLSLLIMKDKSDLESKK